MPQSKEQIAAYKKEYYEKNREQIASKAKEYNKLNKEQIAARQKEYYEKNKEQIVARNKEYYEKNRERWLDYRKEYYKNNKEQIASYNKKTQVVAHIKEYNKKYYANNKEKNNISCSEWYQNNKETVKEVRRFNKYGISSAEYDTMLEEQDNKCKICLTSFTDITLKDGKTPVRIDHCHTTNQVRGLLCNLCNTGLGFFKDNTETLTNAIVYLEHTQE
mgnify:CR=1 FL=1